MFAPTIRLRVRRERSRAAAAAAPWLLKPIRLISARSRGRRNIRGFGLPGCGCAVTVPTSTNANPSMPSASGPRASLSNPAARPSGPGRSRPNAWTRSTGSAGVSQRRSSHEHAGHRRGPADKPEPQAVRGLGGQAREHCGKQQLVHHPPAIMPSAARAAGSPGLSVIVADRSGAVQR